MLMTIASLDYKLYNLTYSENLYVCDANDTLRLKFFDTPDDRCEWQSLSELRQDPVQADAINERLKRQMTMMTETTRLRGSSLSRSPRVLRRQRHVSGTKVDVVVVIRTRW